MNKTVHMILASCLVAGVSVGCVRVAAIYNVKDAPITTATGQEPAADAVQKAIIEAGAMKGWRMAIVEPGHILASIALREHTAAADITYDSKTYNINYKDSTNLGYDGTKQVIHRNYNEWIKYLDGAIRAKLSTAGL